MNGRITWRRFLLAFACGAARLAAQDCEDPGILFTQEKRGHVTHLFAEPVNCLEATITLTADLKNARASPALPLTVELRGSRRIELGTVRPVVPGPWSLRSRCHWLPGTRGGRPDGTAYRLPFATGARHRLIQGHRGKFSHGKGTNDEHALDWAMPEGTPVLAARDGVVTAVRQDSRRGGADPKFKNCGNYIVVRHRDGTFAEYLHLQAQGARVRLGDPVSTGQLLGLSGNTGHSTVPHLHFAVFRTIDGRTRETLPVTFRTAGGEPLTLTEGKTY